MTPSPQYRKTVLILLTLTYGFSFIDRQIMGILAPYIKADMGLSNFQMGLLSGLAFAFLYTLVGIPIAIVADRVNRVKIVSLSLAIWSGFTALTGYAQNFMQIALARVGVGIGEAGCSPPSHSIISDLYPKEQRASALGGYSLGIPFGIMGAYFTTALLMGADPNAVNWRKIFIILGVAGLAFSIVIRLAIKEPVRGAQEGGHALTNTRPFQENLNFLLRIPSWWFMCLGIAFGSFAAYAYSAFQTIYIRQFDPEYDMRTVIIALGFINGIAYSSGAYFGARLSDQWGQKDVRAYAYMSMLSVGMAFPFAVASFWVPTVPLHLVCVAFMLIFLGIYLGPCFALAQTLAPVHMRAMSTALFFFILNMIAMGGGPTIAGYIIDSLTQTMPEVEAVRRGMSIVCVTLLVGGLFFLMASKTLPKDWAAAKIRNEGVENPGQ